MTTQIVAIPSYDDVPKAIDFLVEAFGFERHAVYENSDGTIAHVELILGGSMVMLATPGAGEHGALVSSVRQAGKPTGGFYVVDDDVQARHDRAAAAGAEIIMGPREREHGGTEFTCRDHEGHLWTFGSYDPWATTGQG